MVVEREEVVVDVASTISRRGKHRKRVMRGRKVKGTNGRFAACGEPGNGHKADGFHIPAAFEGVSFAVIFRVVADVCVAAKELDGGVPLLAADDFIKSVVFWGAQGDVAGDEEEVDLAVPDGVLKPLFLDRVFNRLDDGVVRVRGEIEYEAKGQDADTLVLGRELLEPRGQWYSFTRLGIEYVEIGSEIVAFEVGLCHQVFVFRRILLVELMVSRAYDVDMLLFEDIRCISALRIRCII